MTVIVRAVVVVLLFQATVYAQIEVRGAVGFAAFPDNRWNDHALAGGALLAKVRGGLQIGAEALLLSGLGEDRDILIAPLIGYEFGSRRIRPYVIGGAGLLRHRDLTGAGLFWSNGPTYGAGGGVKIHISDHWFVAPEVRVGWEPFFRASLNIGYSF